MDSVDKEIIIAAINKNLSPKAKISFLTQVSAIFVDINNPTQGLALDGAWESRFIH